MPDQAPHERQPSQCSPVAPATSHAAKSVTSPAANRLAHTQAALNNRPSRGGLPAGLKAGIEALSGLSMDDVRVHRGSNRPAHLQAHAYAQGTDIHLAPGQDHHLPHEAWHVVQQKQGRVRATVQLASGVPVNDNPRLEREADVMGARALATVPGATQSLRAPVLFGAQTVQCQLWRWNAHGTPPHWQPIGGTSSPIPAPPPQSGTFDGEQFDDGIYTQATDPTLTGFLNGESYLGKRGLDDQLLGKKPDARAIRVDAVKEPGMTRGSGLHEGVPTDMRGILAQSGNRALIGAQSGFRTSTSQQLFNIGNGRVGAHTGFAPNPSTTGYTHTQGQKGAHDRMRDAVDTIVTSNVTHRDAVINALALRHLEVTPHGQTVLHADNLVGMIPNYHRGLGAVGPLIPGPPDPQRLAIAQDTQRGRERFKRRARAHKRGTGHGHSPSPPRTPIDALGGGGGYIPAPALYEEIEAMPQFPHTQDEDYTANVAAWMTQSQRF